MVAGRSDKLKGDKGKREIKEIIIGRLPQFKRVSRKKEEELRYKPPKEKPKRDSLFPESELPQNMMSTSVKIHGNYTAQFTQVSHAILL